MLTTTKTDHPLVTEIGTTANGIIYYSTEKSNTTNSSDNWLNDDTISIDDKKKIYGAIQGDRNSIFPSKYYEYFLKAKKDYASVNGSEISGKFEVIPMMKENMIQFILITDSSTTSNYWTEKYINNYHKIFPNNQIYIFSTKSLSPVYKWLTNIPLNDDFLEFEWDVEHLKNSLCIFDNVDLFQCTKCIYKKVHSLLDTLIELGRSKNIYLIFCTANINDTASGRKSLNEFDAVVVFKSSSREANKKLLKEHVGLNLSQIANVLETNSRWVFINRETFQVPKYAVSEHKVFLL